MTDWKKASDYPLPDFAANPAEYMLAYDVRSNLLNASFNFLREDASAQFANPQAYLMGMVRQAVGLTENNFAKKYAPADWDAVGAGFKAAYSAFDWLTQLSVNAGDQDSLSIYDAWVAKKGNLYGGHDPKPVNTGDGVNKGTGPGSAPESPILGAQ